MNKKFIVLMLVLLICTGLALSSCNSIPSFEEITTAGENTSGDNSENNENQENSDVPQNNQGSSEEPSADEGTEETTTSEKKPSDDGELIGYTSKGYPITVKNGITYVDGTLIANKTYSLPSSYNPGTLLSECEQAFSEMKAAAAAANHSIWNASGFRSYELQNSLYTRYANRDGKEAADRYSARPGHSEHQSGLAIDLNEITSSFADTAAGKWVAENCWRYGFILRYPQGKEAQTGYMYEPWHIRYVGVELAEKVYNSGLCLEEYFGITSSYESTATPPSVSQETTTAATEPTSSETENPTVLTVG